MAELRSSASNVIGRFFPRATRLQRHALKMICLIPLVLLCALAPDAALAQVDTNFKAADTSSPRDTLKSFIAACNEINRLGSGAKFFDRYDPGNLAVIERAIDCIDQTEFPAFAREERAAEIAACLKEILDRTDLPPWEEIPDSADIKAAGGDEKLTHYRIPDTRITIAKVEQGDRRHEYLFTPGTADRAMKYFKSIQTKPYRTDPPEVSENLYRWFVSAPGNPAVASTVKRLPEFLRQGETWGTANWKWLGLAVILVIALIGIWVAYRSHIYFTNRAQEKNLFLYWLTLGFPIVATLIPLGFKFASYRYLNLRSGPLYLVDFMSIAIALVAALVVIFAASNRLSASVIASPSINPAGLNAQLIRIMSKLASLAASVVLFLYGGQYLGIPIGTLLASAGIGGVAIALGAQDSLRTLFGTLNLLANKPFRVGERIVFDQYDGVVEDVGLQSCRVRLLNGNQLSVPNDKLAGSDIENAGRRKYIRRVGLIHIPLDSSCEKVERAAAIIREELADHEGMTADHPPRVYFDDITPEAYTIKFYYWFSPPNFWDFKEFGEKVNISIFRKFEEEGIQFSLPSRHALWKSDNEQGPLEVNLVDDPAQP